MDGCSVNGPFFKRAGVRLLTAAAVVALAVLLNATPAAAARLAYSTRSNNVVQPQPPAGWCHPIGRGLYSRPDPRCTPGALNPQVTQATIGRTICRRGWTATVRPPESITEHEKALSMDAYGATWPISSYEYDHFVPLELGGATNDRRNLWPELGASPNPKDSVEDALNRAVCEHRLTLGRAQQLIVWDWTKLVGRTWQPPPPPPKPKPHPPPPPPPPRPAPGAWCNASASYNSRYDDYDVYVHSNQPNQDATVSGAGDTNSYYTDSSGYADVYLYVGSWAAGHSVSVQVGQASCSTTL